MHLAAVLMKKDFKYVFFFLGKRFQICLSQYLTILNTLNYVNSVAHQSLVDIFEEYMK